MKGTKYIVADEVVRGGRTLLIRVDAETLRIRPTDPTPYILAWCYDSTDDSWVSGQYFSTLLEAVAKLATYNN